MNFLNSLWVAISFYSILPAPRPEWSKESTKSAICFLPVIGIFVGALHYLWQYLCIKIGMHSSMFSAVAVMIPIFITGGLHMDGFMDTADAISSGQSRERKLEIMRDSNVGAFAVLWCSAYMLLSFGLFSAVYTAENAAANLIVVSVGFILSRALCTLSALTLPNARKDGMLFAFNSQSKNLWTKLIIGAVVLVCILVMVYIELWAGVCASLAGVIVFLYYRHMAMKHFGGATGDSCGFFIQICELSVLAAAFIGSYILKAI